MLRLSVQYASADPAPRRDQMRRWVAATLDTIMSIRRPRITGATLAFRFVDRDEGRALNREYRGKGHATNVLTFAFDETAAEVEADVVICLPVVAREAAEQRKAFADHCAHLVVHGTLHACGYDHEHADEAEAMEAIERRVLARFRIADPYAAEHTASGPA